MADGVAPMLRFGGATKRFGDVVALDDFTLEVGEGELVGLLGPNGAGKTTAIRSLLGHLRLTAGTVEVRGVDAWANPAEAHRHLAYVPGDFPVWPQLTGSQMLDLLGTTAGGYDSQLRDELVDRFMFDPAKQGRAYSKGNRQKIAVIAALMTRAPLLVMDEPTGGLDPLMEAEFRACLREARDRGQTVLLSSHVLSEVEALCERIVVLRRGRLVEDGSLADLRHLRAHRLEATYRGPAPNLNTVDGIDELEVADGVIRFQVRGPIDPILRALTELTEVETLEVREPSLEELFHAIYSEDSTPSGERS